MKKAKDYAEYKELVKRTEREAYSIITNTVFPDCPSSALYIKGFMDKNPSKDNPYHNNYHMYSMVVRCNTLADYAIQRGSEVRKDELLLAAMFHDYEHSGGKLVDSQNIERAIRAIEQSGLLEFSQLEDVCDIIDVTQYPFIYEPFTIEEKIIRDADLLQCTEAGYIYHTYYGLLEEIRIKNSDLTTQQFVVGQLKFLESAKFYTELPKMYEDILKSRILELRLIQDSLFTKANFITGALK